METKTEIKTVMISGDRLLLALSVLKLLGQSSSRKKGSQVVREKLGVNLDDTDILQHALYGNGAEILHETLRSGGNAVGAIIFDASPFIENAIDWRIVKYRREATTTAIATIIHAIAYGKLTEEDFKIVE